MTHQEFLEMLKEGTRIYCSVYIQSKESICFDLAEDVDFIRDFAINRQFHDVVFNDCLYSFTFKDFGSKILIEVVKIPSFLGNYFFCNNSIYIIKQTPNVIRPFVERKDFDSAGEFLLNLL